MACTFGKAGGSGGITGGTTGGCGITGMYLMMESVIVFVINFVVHGISVVSTWIERKLVSLCPVEVRQTEQIKKSKQAMAFMAIQIILF